jgi:hypothetical protein
MAKKSSRAAQKAQVTAAQQRLAEMKATQSRKETHRRVLLWTVVAVVLVLVVGSIGYIIATKEPSKDVVQPVPTADVDTSGITGVKAWKVPAPGATATDGEVQATHVGSKSVQYFTYPPVGGPHDPRWLTCGRYSSTQRWENVVHDMEHGAVVITYRKDLAADQIAALKDLFAKEPTVVVTDGTNSQDLKSKYLDLFPYDGQKSPIVLSAWGRQLEVTTASDDRIQKFIDAFRVKQGFTQEYGALCTGGVGKPEAT